MIINKNNLKYRRPHEKRTSTDLIIVHHAASMYSTMEQEHQWHLDKGWNGYAYNFRVDKQGVVTEGRPIWAADADALEHNDDSLSIMFAGDFDKEHMTDAQVSAGIELVAYLRDLYPTVKIVVGHRDVGKTSCPGRFFDDRILISKTKETISTRAEAIKKLELYGVTNLPEYRAKVERISKYLDQILIDMANLISDFESK